MFLTLIFYFVIAIFGCQFLNKILSPDKNKNKEGFSHELESGPFDEQQKYNIPQPSEVVDSSTNSQKTNSELNNLYLNSNIDLSGKIVDSDDEEDEESDNEPVASNEAEVSTIAPFDQ